MFALLSIGLLCFPFTKKEGKPQTGEREESGGGFAE